MESVGIHNKPNTHNYALIVVGRMGHGKSSFCRMLLNDSQKQKIKVVSSMESVTQVCGLYKSNFFKSALGESCWIMDTPGLDSKNAIHLVVEDIDEEILKNRLDVIGIAYVVDIHQRDKNQDGDSYIFTFLQILRMKYCYKYNLSFCILSKFDIHYESEEENQEIFAQLKGEFQKNGYPQTWNNHIQWCSQPCKDIKRFEKKIKGQCKELFYHQFVRLKELLSNNSDNSAILDYKSYVNHAKLFQAQLISSIQEKYKTFEYANEKFELKIKTPVQKQSTQAIFNIKQFYRLVPDSAKLLFIAVTPVFIGLFALINITSEYHASKFIPGSPEAVKKELDARMQRKMRLCLINLINACISFKGREIVFTKNSIIDEVECFDFMNQRIKVKDEGKYLSVVLKEGDNTVIFRCRPPSKESWKKFIEDASREYYNKK